MSVTQKMFAYSSCMLITILTFTHAIPVPMPEEVHPEYAQFVSAQMVQPVGESLSTIEIVNPSEAVVRPIRSASPLFGLFAGFEKPHKSHHQHHNNHEEEYEPQHHRPQHHYNGGGAGSFASAGSYAGGHGGGQSQSSANSQSASFGFGPFQASISSSNAHSNSHSGGGFSDY